MTRYDEAGRTENPTRAAEAGTYALGDLRVSRLGFGAMRLTGGGVWGEPEDPAEARRVLRRALELGVTLIDTADSYGPEVSERLIAEALHPYPDDLVIATKGGSLRPGPGEWRPDGRPAHLRGACEGSLRRLRLDTIDLYQLHTVDPEVPYAESVGALADLQDEGKVRHVGISNVDADQLATAREIVEVVCVQNRYNLVDRDSEDLVDVCEREEIGFLPWFPLGAGPLAASDGPLAPIAEREGVSPAQLALAWLLHRSPAVLPIPGTSSVAHLEENVAAAGIDLDEAVLREVAGAVG